MLRGRSFASCASLAAGFFAFVLTATADNWPAWRGPEGNGQCTEHSLPLRWSPQENVRWKVALPGPGNSTPVIWGNRIFLTQATEKGHKRALLCLARGDGSTLWERSIPYTEKEPTHETNPYCSASPVTDGKRVIASHGSAGVVCYDLQGNLVWQRDLGKCEHIWGNAASPILYGDLMILNFGPGERTFLIALDKKTGKDVWKVEEPGGKLGGKGQAEWLGSWSTPVIAASDGHDELVMSWPGVVKAYNPHSGELLWTCKGLEKDSAPDRLVYTSPLAQSGVVVAMAGYGGPSLAVRMGGRGEVTSTHRLWRVTQGPQRIGSGVVVDEHIYMVNEPGTAQCIELKTGKALWTERVGPGAWGSLVHADGRLYVTNVEGETLVLAVSPKFEILSRNPLKERTLSSLAISDGMIFIRTYEHLWCIGK
jgi:outer membrane protein assembly factor BamB